MNNVVIVERKKRSPSHILTHIKIRAMEDGKEKERLQRQQDLFVKQHNDRYFSWLEESHINDFTFNMEWATISFTFDNLEDAMAFKLRWT